MDIIEHGSLRSSVTLSLRSEMLQFVRRKGSAFDFAFKESFYNVNGSQAAVMDSGFVVRQLTAIVKIGKIIVFPFISAKPV